MKIVSLLKIVKFDGLYERFVLILCFEGFVMGKNYVVGLVDLAFLLLVF